jgi:hypothetical protein
MFNIPDLQYIISEGVDVRSLEGIEIPSIKDINHLDA